MVLNRILEALRRPVGRIRCWLLGLESYPPNYVFNGPVLATDVILDVGTGDDPDFSRLMVSNYKTRCFCVDPTRKHASALREVAAAEVLIEFLPYALGSTSGSAEFFESDENMSGSLLAGHQNISNAAHTAYSVRQVTLTELADIVAPAAKVAIAKIDIEGAEYDLIAGASSASLRRFGQLIIEFHHGRISGITRRDTLDAIAKMESLGMRSFVFNGRDCLFYWPK